MAKLTWTRELSHNEAATLLAALKMFQEVLRVEEAEHYNNSDMLTVGEIAEVCEALKLQIARAGQEERDDVETIDVDAMIQRGYWKKAGDE